MWKGLQIGVVIDNDRDTTGVFGDMVEGIDKVLVGESTIAALYCLVVSILIKELSCKPYRRRCQGGRRSDQDSQY
jgi:hypothetical protein